MMRLEEDSHHPLNFSQIPTTWAIVSVGEVVRDIRVGFSSGRHNRERVGVPHLRPMNISRGGRIVLDELKYVPADANPSRLASGDVLFNNTNSAELVGKTALVSRSVIGDAEWAFSNHMTRLRLPPGLSSRFIAHQLHYLWMTGYFRHRCTRHVNQASISLRTLTRSVPLLVPPELEQERIVADVDRQFNRLDAIEALLKRVMTSLAEYTLTVLRKACEGTLVSTEAELVKENRDFESGEQLLARILMETAHRKRVAKRVDTTTVQLPMELPPLEDATLPTQNIQNVSDLPSGWTWARVRQVGEVRLGRQRAPKHENGAHPRPYLRVANVYEDSIDTSDVLEMNFTPQEYEVYRLEANDVLLNEGQSLSLVGRPAMFRNELPGACYQNTLIRFRAHPGVSPSFALIVFRHYLHSQKFQKIARWSTNIAHLGADRFANLEFPLPPLAEQERIALEVMRCLSLATTQQEVIESVQQRVMRLRHILLKKAFSGELTPQDPMDEPVEKLIERIEQFYFERERRSQKKMEKSVSPPRSDKKKGRSMKKRPLSEVLMQADKPLSPNDLWEGSGFEEDVIQDFYEELKREVMAGRVVQETTLDGAGLQLRLNNSKETDTGQSLG